MHPWHAHGRFEFPNIYIFHDLDVPSAMRIRELEVLLDDCLLADFAQCIGHCDAPFPLHEAMWTCQHLFNHVPKNVASKRILLYTNDQDPSAGDARERIRCVQRYWPQRSVRRGSALHIPKRRWKQPILRTKDRSNNRSQWSFPKSNESTFVMLNQVFLPGSESVLPKIAVTAGCGTLRVPCAEVLHCTQQWVALRASAAERSCSGSLSVLVRWCVKGGVADRGCELRCLHIGVLAHVGGGGLLLRRVESLSLPA